MTQSLTRLCNGRILEPERDHLLDGFDLLIDGAKIVALVPRGETTPGTRDLDLAGRTLMPGLVDCHLHVVSSYLDLWKNAIEPSSLTALRAARIMEKILQRGFTTVRDACGADIGLVQAVDEGLIEGPRLIICGKGFSITGGHCDIRARTDDRTSILEHRLGSMGRLVDGVEAARLAVREELKAGAKFIKIMANGGVSSPNDPIHSLQYSRAEIAAIVEEAGNAGTYVSAHLYTDAAIRRAVDCGVHSLEHCNLIEAATAERAAAVGAIAVPTLVAYEALALEGEALGLSPESAAKIEAVREGGLRSLAIMRDAGLRMAFGSDLLGPLQKYHSLEFEILARVLKPIEIIRSATLVGAMLCRLEGQVGCLKAGAFADLVLVDGNPLDDITRLADDGAHLAAILRGGRFVKGELPPIPISA